MCYKVKSISEKGSAAENPLKNNTGFTDSQKRSEIGALKIAFTFYNWNKERLPLFLAAVAKCHFILQPYWMQASFGLIQHQTLGKQPWLSITEMCLMVLRSTPKCIYSSKLQRCLMFKVEGRKSLLLQFVQEGQISTYTPVAHRSKTILLYQNKEVPIEIQILFSAYLPSPQRWVDIIAYKIQSITYSKIIHPFM